MISKEFVTAMGGGIEVVSEPGRGSTFAFAIPLPAAPHAAPRPRPLAGARCVVASANPALSASLAAHLDALGAAPVLLDSETAASLLEDGASASPRLAIADMACRGILESPALPALALRLLVAPPGDAASARLPADTLIVHQPVTYTQLADALAAESRRATEHPPRDHDQARFGACDARILLVEDNPVNRLVAGAMLEKLGLSFDWAGDGADALAKLAHESFDLVLMDMEMPVMDGVAATRELRRRERDGGTRRLPVIAMTANAMAEDRARCLEVGMHAHLGKPVRLDELGDALERFLPASHSAGSGPRRVPEAEAVAPG
jgi:CheY-like chemotaxis protein